MNSLCGTRGKSGLKRGKGRGGFVSLVNWHSRIREVERRESRVVSRKDPFQSRGVSCEGTVRGIEV